VFRLLPAHWNLDAFILSPSLELLVLLSLASSPLVTDDLLHLHFHIRMAYACISVWVLASDSILHQTQSCVAIDMAQRLYIDL